MIDFTVVFYETADGKKPVEDFLNSLNAKMGSLSSEASLAAISSDLFTFSIMVEKSLSLTALLRRHKRRPKEKYRQQRIGDGTTFGERKQRNENFARV